MMAAAAKEVAAEARLNVHQRIIAVMRSVGYLRKDVKVQAGGGQSYSGTSHDAVVGLLRAHMIDAGLTATTSLISSDSVEGLTKSGARRVVYRATYSVCIINADDPADRVEMVTEAHADDGGDKAPGKAISYALKTSLLKIFLLETGQDDESRYVSGEPAAPVEPITFEQVAHLREMLEATGSDEAKFLQWIGAKSLGEVPSTSYARAERALTGKLTGGKS